MKQLRCAVIGCGRIGCGYDDYSNSKTVKTHAGSYFRNPKTKLVALCDIDKVKLQKYGKKYNVKGLYTKSSDMFRNENIDCVSICTHADSHLDLVKEAAQYNVKGIFLEKPISDSLQNARKIIQICKTHNIILSIDHHKRFDTSYQYMRKLFYDKKLGNIQLINIYYGRGVANSGSHLFDILRLFFGEILYIKANLSKNKSNYDLDPNLDIEIEFRNKTICRLQALDATNYGLFEMDVLGTAGRIRLNFVSDEIEYFKISTTNFLDAKKLEKSKIKVRQSSYSTIQLGVENLVRSMRKKTKPLCTGEDGYKSLELIIASIQSSKRGKKIHLPILRNNYKIASK